MRGKGLTGRPKRQQLLLKLYHSSSRLQVLEARDSGSLLPGFRHTGPFGKGPVTHTASMTHRPVATLLRCQAEAQDPGTENS